MVESLQLRGLSERTQEAYVRAVRQLADHYHKSPDLISEEELRQYFLHIKNVKKYSRASSTIAICGIKFFYEKTLSREFTTFKLHDSSSFFLQCLGMLPELKEDGIVVAPFLARQRLFVNRITPTSLDKLESISVCNPGSDPP